ncbi:NAD(P)-dependent oxidoreductase, partial [Acinetobacter baumannii]
EADVVTLHVPATAATEGMIGAAEMARMKRGAYLINNARGSVVDLDALAAAIREKRLGGAAVDVFPEEPEGNGPGFETPLRGLA